MHSSSFSHVCRYVHKCITHMKSKIPLLGKWLHSYQVGLLQSTREHFQIEALTFNTFVVTCECAISQDRKCAIWRLLMQQST